MQIEFDKIYARNNAPYGTQPSPWIVKVLKYMPAPAIVLDLGICYGRNAIFLAKNGYNVTGVDISQVALDLCKAASAQANVKIKCHREDLANYSINETYDVIYSTATLHFIADDSKRNSLLKQIMLKTRSGGINILSVATSDKIAMNFPYYFTQRELKELYANWDILDCAQEENTFTNGKIGTIAFIIARKK